MALSFYISFLITFALGLMIYQLSDTHPRELRGALEGISKPVRRLALFYIPMLATLLMLILVSWLKESAPKTILGFDLDSGIIDLLFLCFLIALHLLTRIFKMDLPDLFCEYESRENCSKVILFNHSIACLTYVILSLWFLNGMGTITWLAFLIGRFAWLDQVDFSAIKDGFDLQGHRRTPIYVCSFIISCLIAHYLSEYIPSAISSGLKYGFVGGLFFIFLFVLVSEKIRKAEVNLHLKSWLTKHKTRFSRTLLYTTAFATILNIFICIFFKPFFALNENQLLYLFSLMAQVVASIFGLTLTAFVFFSEKFRESAKGDDTYYDAIISLLNRFFLMLIIIAITCGVAIIFCVSGIIALHNWIALYPFIINESVFLFVISIISVLIFGMMLLDPGKLDKEIAKMKLAADQYYRDANSDETQLGDFRDFLKSYNSLENIIVSIAEQFMQTPNYTTYTSNNPRKFKPLIIQSLKALLAGGIINDHLYGELHNLRMYRNALVHGDDFTISLAVCNRIAEIEAALKAVRDVFEDGSASTEDRNVVVQRLHALSKKEHQ